MTVPRSRVQPEVALTDSVRAELSGIDGASDLFFAPLETLRVDRIGLSARASLLIAAGLAVRAYVMSGIEDIRQRIALDRNRSLVLDSGFYGVKS